MTDVEHSRARRLRRTAVLVALLVAGLAFAWWMLEPASEPVTIDGATGRAGAVGVTERLADAAEEGSFRIALTGEDLALLLREALDESPVAIRDLTVEVHPDGAGAARLEAAGVMAGSGLPVRATVVARHAGERLDVELQESRIAGVSLPGAARRGIDDLLEGAVDVGGVLRTEGVRIDSVEVENGALVLAGLAADPERVAERLRSAARQRAGVREPPPERLGRGSVGEREQPGDAAVVALGDSLAAGTATSDHRDAFSSRLHRALGGTSSERGYVNLAEPGATARSMLEGGQLGRARDVLAGRDVDVVVVSVGSNELLGLLQGQDCGQDLASRQCQRAIDDTATEHATLLDDVLGEVVDAAGSARVVLLTPYNPFSTGGGGTSEEHTDDAVRTLRTTAEPVAQRHGVLIADPMDEFRGRAVSLTRLREQPPDIHPTPLGHDVLAWTVLQALLS